MVSGKNTRYWTSQETAQRHLLSLGLDNDKLWESTFVSPAAAEKLLKGPAKKSLVPFIAKRPGNPSMAFADDPRPALANDALDAFADIADVGEIDDAFND
jgi:hypothetical protein